MITPTPLPVLTPLSALDLAIGIAQIIGALATGGALLVTYFALIEMRRQTKLANDPLLKIRGRLQDPAYFEGKNVEDKINMSAYDEAPYKKWQTYISNNLHQELSGLQDKIFCLELTNKGKSEITHLSIEYTYEVEMIDEKHILPVPSQPQKFPGNLKFMVDLEEKSSLLIPIVRIKYFPKFTFKILKLDYTDIRKIKFHDYDGDSEYINTNGLLIPTEKTISEVNPEKKHPEEELP